MVKRFLLSISLLITAFFVSLSTASAQSPLPSASPAPIMMMEAALVKGPTFMAEENLVLAEHYAGPVFAAGGNITMSGEVDQDLVVAGGTIRVTGTVSGDVYAVGGTILIDGNVKGNVITAGGEVQVAPTAEIGGTLITGTERLSFAGRMMGPLYAGANRLFLNGQIGGDVWAGGETLELGQAASIAGNLRAQVGQPYSPDPDATVAGTTDVQQQTRPEKPERRFQAGLLGKALFQTGWRFALLALGLFFVPAVLHAGVERLTHNSAEAFLSGIVTLIGLPFLMMVLFVTLIGAPLAGLLFLVYLLVLLTAWVVPSLWVGQRILPGQNEYIQALLGVVIIVALGLLPIVGGLIKLVLAVFGFGVVWKLLRRTPITA